MVTVQGMMQTMPLRNLLLALPWRRAKLLRETAVQLAQMCHAEAWQRAGRRAVNMSSPEARGYLRARAADLLADWVDPVLAERGLTTRLRAELLGRATEELVAQIIGDLPKAEPTLAPRRKAA